MRIFPFCWPQSNCDLRMTSRSIMTLNLNSVDSNTQLAKLLWPLYY